MSGVDRLGLVPALLHSACVQRVTCKCTTSQLEDLFVLRVGSF